MENSELITKALNYIQAESAKNDITIDDIASHAGFSTDYFNRVFFAHTGFNIMEYVRFSRLKNAAQLLRLTSNSILDIALECGYEAHESFSRAFKNQYGVSPSEYRERNKKTELHYGDFHNDTIGARLLHEFKSFKIADSDEIIDYLLETDPLRYGYSAICFRINGGVALYDGESFKNGFVWFSEWDNRFEGDIICNDWNKIAEYKKTFSDQRFDMVLLTSEPDQIIMDELKKRGVLINGISRRQINIYTADSYTLPFLEGISMRLIKYEDFSAVKKFFFQKHPADKNQSPRLKYLENELYQRDVMGNTEHSVFMFGIFKNNSLIGISDGGLQSAHGFTINNCIITSFLPEYENEKLYQYAFKFVTNSALERGALPVDDTQTPFTPNENRSGSFNSTDLGYKAVMNICIFK